MKKAFIFILAALCLLTALAVSASAEGYDTPFDIAASYMRLCAGALQHNPDLAERGEAFPALLEEIGGHLNPKSSSARALGKAVDAMRQPGDESARKAEKLLWEAAWKLREGDIRTSFALSDLAAAARYGLLPVSETAQFVSVFSEKAAAGVERFVMVCPKGMRELMQGGTTYREEVPMVMDVANQCGICDFCQVFNDDTGLLIFDDVHYYAGTRILRAWRDGNTEALTEDERRTLEAALEIAGAATGSDLERERQIHDALCARVSYYTDAGLRDRKDSAVGALLDGRADCDGYSDAFFLCGSLAGLQVRYINGDGIEDGPGDLPEGGHMWNLVGLDGRWVSVDVTWDDGDGRIHYVNYNLGAERIGLTHLWDERTQLVQMEYGLSNDLRDPSLAVTAIGSWDDLYNACRDAALDRPHRLTIACPLGADARDAGDWIARCLYATGVTRFSWYTQNALLELVDLEYAPEFAICDTADGAAAYIEDCAQRGVRDFTLYFTPELSRQMFSDDRAGIDALIGASSLANTRYSYNEENRMISVSGAEYHAVTNAAGSVDDIRQILWQALSERWDRVWFVLPEGMTFESVSGEVSRVVYSCGARSYSWSLSGSRVTLSDIDYYPEFALVSDEGQLMEYLESCRAAGITGFRVYCRRELYDALSANGFSRFFELLHEADFWVEGIGYDDQYAVLVVE